MGTGTLASVQMSMLASNMASILAEDLSPPTSLFPLETFSGNRQSILTQPFHFYSLGDTGNVSGSYLNGILYHTVSPCLILFVTGFPVTNTHNTFSKGSLPDSSVSVGHSLY